METNDVAVNRIVSPDTAAPFDVSWIMSLAGDVASGSTAAGKRS